MIYPYIAARWHGGTQSKINRVVMHSTVSPCVEGGARKIANMFHTSSRVASAHFVVDPGEIIRCLPDTTIGYHAPPNAGSIGVEQCDWSRGGQWQGTNHQAMLHLSAGLVASLCVKWDVPIVHINAADLRAGKRGICSHLNVTNAWHQTTHTDPAGFPWDQFLEMVHAAAGGVAPKPPAVRQPYPGHLLMLGTHDHANTKLVQTQLNRRSVTAPHLKVDGIYGTKTQTRVEGFQRKHHLTDDGVVGPKTWTELFT